MCRSCIDGHHVTRIPLTDGSRVFMEWHRYFGPSFFRDRACRREIDDWYTNPQICAALDWFQGRGKIA